MQATIQDITKVGDSMISIFYALSDGSQKSFQMNIDDATSESILDTIQKEVDRLDSIDGKIQDLKNELINSKPILATSLSAIKVK